MGDESVTTFDRVRQSLDYDHAKNSNSKWTKSTENDIKKRVDKILNPTLS